MTRRFVLLAWAALGAGCETLPSRPDRPVELPLPTVRGLEGDDGTGGSTPPNGRPECACPENGEHGGSKTLFEWAAGPERLRFPEEPADGEEEPLTTDRPDFTEASSTVGRGRVQLEAGYTYTRDRDGGTRFESHSYPEALFRIGLFADWFELRIGQNFADENTTAAGERIGADGPEDLYLGVKLALTEQKGALPEMALIVQTDVPTGDDDFGAPRLLPGVSLLYGWDVIEDLLAAGGSTQANRRFDGAGHYYVEVAQSFTLGYSLTDKLGAYTEYFGLYPTSSIDPDTLPEHYFNGGFTYLVNPNFQLDVRAGVGLNDHADDFFTGAGFAYRY